MWGMNSWTCGCSFAPVLAREGNLSPLALTVVNPTLAKCTGLSSVLGRCFNAVWSATKELFILKAQGKWGGKGGDAVCCSPTVCCCLTCPAANIPHYSPLAAACCSACPAMSAPQPMSCCLLSCLSRSQQSPQANHPRAPGGRYSPPHLCHP